MFRNFEIISHFSDIKTSYYLTFRIFRIVLQFPDCSQFPDYFPFFQKLSLSFPRISQIPDCPARFHLLIRSYAPKIFVLLVYVNGLIFEELMYVHPSEEFLLEQKVGLNPLLSEILPASTNLGQCSASDLILRCHWHHMKRSAFHIEAKC